MAADVENKRIRADAAGSDESSSVAVSSPPDGSASGGLAATPGGEERSAASETTTLALGFYVSQVLLFVAGFVQKGLLGPADTGYWSLVGAFWPILTLATLGAFVGAIREV